MQIAQIFMTFKKIGVEEHDRDVEFFTGNGNMAVLRMCKEKYAIYPTLIYGRIAEISASYRKSGLRNTTVTSDFRPEVEIRPFCTCTMKNMQYNCYLWPNCQNFHVVKEIGVKEHDGDIRFYTGSGNTAISCMRNASGHNYWNSSFIVDLAIRQIPRFTERISS